MIQFDFNKKPYRDLWALFDINESRQNINLPIPDELGTGYVSRIELGEMMGIMIHNYELLVDVKGQKSADASKKDIIVFSFRNVFNTQLNQPGILPSVQVSSGDMEVDLSFPAHSQISAIIINVHKNLLSSLIYHNDHTLLQTLISGDKPYLYEEFVSAAIHEAAAKMLQPVVDENLQAFFFRIKAEELIYLFFVELLKRKNLGNYALNSGDVNTVYTVRDHIINDLVNPPNLPDLAKFSGMSESKLNRLFKQIFGSPIYNYHQKFRIYRAAELLRTSRISVSEAGYNLGFTNLGHFSKLFQRYMGEKPKKYSASVQGI